MASMIQPGSNDRIAVLGGTGQQGRGLAHRFAHAGLRVIVGSRDADRARETVAGWSRTGQPVEVADNAGALGRANIAVLAVPFMSVDPLLQQLQPHFKDGALVIDLTVPVTFTAGKMELVDVAEGSAAEHVRARLPPTAARSYSAPGRKSRNHRREFRAAVGDSRGSGQNIIAAARS